MTMMTKKQKQTRKQNSSQSIAQPAVELTFMEHIHEVRGRLMWIVASLVVASTIGYQFRELLVGIIVAPLHGEKLIYLNPGGGFSFIFNICLYFGALVTIPVIMYHLYSFLQPVIGRRSRRLMTGIVLISILLAAIGIGFGYLLVIPGAIHFLGGFAGDTVVANLTTDAYLNFTVMHLFGMAALFQLPLLLFIIDHIRPLPPGMLFRLQRWVIAGSIIAAAVITPTPDPANLFLVALPIIGIYQLGVIIVWLRRRPYHAARRAEKLIIQSTAKNSTEKSLLASQIDVPESTGIVLPDTPVHSIVNPVVSAVDPAQVLSQKSVKPAVNSGLRTRSMDGMAPRTRMATSGIAVPKRNVSAQPVHAPVSRHATSHQANRRVSMDGILI